MSTKKNLSIHPIHADKNIEEFDVFIAGSGPIGATYARLLVDAGLNVIMTEIGDQDTRVPGAHKKNEIEYQKDIDRFVRVIQGALSTVSIPTSSAFMPTIDPIAWVAPDPEKRVISNGRNSFQKEYNNLAAEAVTRGVGGMSTHWTCATPEFLKGLERPQIFTNETEDDNEWGLLYTAARALIGTSENEYNECIRHNVVLNALKKAYPNRGVKALPLACHRLDKGSPYVQWHAADNVYGDMFLKRDKKNKQGVQRGTFVLLTNTRCTRLVVDGQSGEPEIKLVEVRDLLEDRFEVPSEKIDFYIKAKTFVVAAGAVATPQILANSGFGGTRDKKAKLIPNLAKYITEQPMAFSQIVLRQELVDDIANLTDKPQWWKSAVTAHKNAHGEIDPLPIPYHDGEPQVTIPATVDRPWHTQIHRDAFSYGEAGPTVDSRVVVDLRFFGLQSGVPENQIIFETSIRDAYGMPQPTFEYAPTQEHSLQATNMMNDMTDVANKLGGYLPGSNPQFMTPGLALHLGGTVRLGSGSDEKKTVANWNSQVWKFKNLYVGGNGVIPTPFAANPTLTSMCFAIRSAYKIAQDLKKGKLTPALPEDTITPTPKEWVNWATDKEDPNFCDHKNLRKTHRYV